MISEGKGVKILHSRSRLDIWTIYESPEFEGGHYIYENSALDLMVARATAHLVYHCLHNTV